VHKTCVSCVNAATCNVMPVLATGTLHCRLLATSSCSEMSSQPPASPPWGVYLQLIVASGDGITTIRFPGHGTAGQKKWRATP
jgi:hypothetical protein